MNLNNTLPTQSELVSSHFEIFGTKLSEVANANGEHSLTAFLGSPRLNNAKDQPITCTLFPTGTGGYLFEVSPQLGCLVGCDFCGCGPLRGNLTPDEVVEQLRILQEEAHRKGIKLDGTNKIEFADGGELLLNPNCIEIIHAVTNYLPVKVKLSTVLPNTKLSRRNLEQTLVFMRDYEPQINFQISLYSTDKTIRQRASGVPLFSFEELRVLGQRAMEAHPTGRKMTLTFTLKSNSHCFPQEIVNILTPDIFVVRLHPYKDNGIERDFETIDEEEYMRLEQEFHYLHYEIIGNPYDQLERHQLTTGGTKALTTIISTKTKVTLVD